jgi:predicted secreted Zn-dependent protease
MKQFVGCLVLAAALVACQATGPTLVESSETVPAATPAVSPGTTNSCAVVIRQAGALVDAVGAELLELRPLVVATPFESGAAAAKIARISATFRAFDGFAGLAAKCSSSSDIATAVAEVRSEALAFVAAASAGSRNDARTQRPAAAGLVELLPAVVAIGRSVEELGAAIGLDKQVAIAGASAEPLGSLPPLPTPTPRTPIATPAPPKVASVGASYFGPNSVVSTYRVTGSTPFEISSSFHANGPYLEWLKARATGLTKPSPHFRFTSRASTSGCIVVATAKPAVYFSFTIVLPQWDPPRNASSATVTWWNDTIREIAAHEKHHVGLFRASATAMTRAVATSTCDDLQQKLSAALQKVARQNCEFDMREYGAALGLSLSSCVNR